MWSELESLIGNQTYAFNAETDILLISEDPRQEFERKDEEYIQYIDKVCSFLIDKTYKINKATSANEFRNLLCVGSTKRTYYHKVELDGWTKEINRRTIAKQNFTLSFFENCSFKSIIFSECLFSQTKFINCEFDDCTFINCGFILANFSDNCFVNDYFLQCGFGCNFGWEASNDLHDCAFIDNQGLIGAENAFPKDKISPIICPEKGSYTAFKKAYINVEKPRIPVLVTLEIPADAARSSADSRKCRASKARVLSIERIDNQEAISEAYSGYNHDFWYKTGRTLEVLDFDTDRWQECAPGIHHFMTVQEAIDY